MVPVPCPRPCILLACSAFLVLGIATSECLSPKWQSLCFQELLDFYTDLLPEKAATATFPPPGKACLFSAPATSSQTQDRGGLLETAPTLPSIFLRVARWKEGCLWAEGRGGRGHSCI